MNKAILFIVLILVSCNAVFYQPTRGERYRPIAEKLPFVDYWIDNGKGQALHARLFPSRSLPSKGLLLHFHGNAENLATHFVFFHWIAEEGYDYLIFDYSGYGESQGVAGRAQSVQDGLRLLQFSWDSLPSARRRFVVVGQSLGGAIAPASLGRWPLRDSVDAMILDATFDRYPRAARRALGGLWWTWILQPLGWLTVSGEEDPYQYYPQLRSIPTILTHCEDDPVVPFAFAREIQAQLNENSRLWSFPRCGHPGYFFHARTAGRFRLMQYLESLP